MKRKVTITVDVDCNATNFHTLLEYGVKQALREIEDQNSHVDNKFPVTGWDSTNNPEILPGPTQLFGRSLTQWKVEES
jgi:hypothetical protein